MGQFAEILINNLAGIISAVGVIVVAWWTYDKSRRDKEVEEKAEARKARAERGADALAAITGHLWGVLLGCRADRVYLMQPHPLGGVKYLSVTAEVCRAGVQPIRDAIQNLPVAQVSEVVKRLKSEDWIWWQDDGADVDDARFRALLLMHGCRSTAAARITEGREWIGTLMVGYLDAETSDEAEAERRREAVTKVCGVIALTLPEVEEK